MAHELTFEQIQDSKRVFDLHKKSEDNNTMDEAKMSIEMLLPALKELNFDVTESSVEEIKETMKLGKELDFPTFLRIAAVKFKQEEFVKELELAFKAFDKNNKGTLSYDELRAVITDYGPKLTLEEGDELLKELELGQKDKFNYKDFVHNNL